MKLALLTGLTLGVCVAAHAADAPATAPAAGDAAAVLKTTTDKFSYGIGLNWGNQCRIQSIDINPAVVLRGLYDGLSNSAPLMTPQEIQTITEQVRKELTTRNEQKMAEMKVKNKEAADKFLAENEKKPGVKKTESGLQYKVIKEGTGPKPKRSDQVAVHYKGTLINGTEFDSSFKRNEPTTFGVGAVIPGWTEALTNMNVGSKWEVYIPPNLAYGEGGSRPMIEPNSALIFEVELIEIKPPPTPPQPITSDIIKVPSKADLDKGAQIEVIKPQDLHKYTNQAAGKAPTNAPAPK